MSHGAVECVIGFRSVTHCLTFRGANQRFYGFFIMYLVYFQVVMILFKGLAPSLLIDC